MNGWDKFDVDWDEPLCCKMKYNPSWRSEKASRQAAFVARAAVLLYILYGTTLAKLKACITDLVEVIDDLDKPSQFVKNTITFTSLLRVHNTPRLYRLGQKQEYDITTQKVW